MTERSKAGQDRARAAGKYIGRSKKVFRRDRVHELHAQGVSYNQIAARLRVSKGTVINIMPKFANRRPCAANRQCDGGLRSIRQIARPSILATVAPSGWWPPHKEKANGLKSVGQ